MHTSTPLRPSLLHKPAPQSWGCRQPLSLGPHSAASPARSTRKGLSTASHVRSRGAEESLSSATDTFPADKRQPPAKELVDELLKRISKSDSGVALEQSEEAAVNELINQLEDVGRQQQAPKQSGQPAGGGFRSKPGRLLFQTRELCQSIFKPNLATNKVGFALFGFILGSIGLRGKFTPQGDSQETVRVEFEPPRLELPGGINLAVGPTSSVILSTTYLDERVRLGRGGRGSSFVFTKGGQSDQAGMENIGLGRTTFLGYTILLSLAAAFCGGAFKLLQAGTVQSKIIAAPPALLGVAICFGLWLNIQFSRKPK